jgi:hypothetical protein
MVTRKILLDRQVLRAPVLPGDHGEDSAVAITAVDDLTAEGRREDGGTVGATSGVMA